MTQALRGNTGRFMLGICGLIIGSVLMDVAVAQTTPTPPPTFSTREQNLDANGFIRVHEQGVLKADVNVSNFPSSVSVNNFPSSINVGNFPATQNVNVTGGQLRAVAPPVTAAFSEIFSAGPGETTTIQLPATINATTISVSKGDTEGAIFFKSPTPPTTLGFRSITSVFHIDDPAGKVPLVDHSFTRPVPINAIVIQCRNEQFLCWFSVDIVGDPGV
jgi:hypothetical protein